MPAKKFIHLYLMVCLAAVWPFSAQGGQSQSEKPCSISIQDLTQIRGLEDTALVDVRNASDYQIYQVPGSINIKLHELKAKTFLKNKRLVLVGYGYDSEKLLEACKALKSFGFQSVRVLDNGIAGWAITKDQSIDSPHIIQSVFYINPADIAHIENTSRILVIDLTGKNSNPLNNYFEHITTITAPNNDAAKTLSKIQTSNNQQYGYVIVVDEDGQGYPSLYSLNHSNNKIPVMFLSGGISGLQDFEAQKTAMTNKKEFTLQNLKGCEN